jgi:hypothetical protein
VLVLQKAGITCYDLKIASNELGRLLVHEDSYGEASGQNT